MIDFIRFYAVLVSLGFLFFPISTRLFGFLPDKGYLLSRIIGLGLGSYIFWVLGFLRIVPNSFLLATISLIPFLVYLVFYLKRGGIKLIVENKRAFLKWEIVFLIIFSLASLVTSFNPSISGTEKPFEFMFLNSINNSTFFPPYDAWFGIEPISYYYFGYVILTFLAKLSGVATSVIFNLGISLTLASSLVVFSFLVSYLVEKQIKFKKILLVFTLFFLAGNLEGLIEMLAIHGFNSDYFYSLVNIQGLEGAKNSLSWYPTEHWFWWRATRLATSWNVMEFPFFSFLLGDLHPHLLAIPYFGVLLLLIYRLFKNTSLLVLLCVSFFLGLVASINTWFSLISASIILVVLFLRSSKKITSILTFFFICLMGVLFFSPLFINVNSAVSGISLNTLIDKASFLPSESVVSYPSQFLIFWGPLLLMSLIFIFKKINKPTRNEILISMGIGTALLLIWLSLFLASFSLSDLLTEIRLRGSSLISLTFIFLTFVLSLIMVFQVNKDDKSEKFNYLLLSMGTLLIFICELFFLKDAMQGRYNTVFKSYFIAWILLSIFLSTNFLKTIVSFKENKYFVFSILSFLIIVWVYPVTSLFNRTNGFNTSGLTLNGLDFYEKTNPEEFKAIEWLKQNYSSGLILEASGNDYSADNLVSAYSGIPTVVGWTGVHELQLRGGDSERVLQRLNDVNYLFSGSDRHKLRELLTKYDIKFVYLGPTEQNKYQLDPGRFEKFGKRVYRNEKVSIYKIN